MSTHRFGSKYSRTKPETFATIDKDTPQTLIAHLFAFDNEGVYFRTGITKPFYEQLKKQKKYPF